MTKPSEESRPSRFVVGIDLGTTNSAITYFDTKSRERQPTTFLVDQVTALGEIEARATLPSFHYEPSAGELSGDQVGLIGLPWGNPWAEAEPPWVVGAYARESGARVPGRLVVSTKSWLSHSGVDRTADLLPFHGAADVRKVSPVTVSARYLGHLRAAWDHRFPEDPLADQEVIVTVPASFDEIARELTVEAARKAGLPRIVLLEEPQAAFYAWIAAQGDAWNQAVKCGDRILICDVGGGTTDLSLIEMRRGESGGDGASSAHRIAVGDHLILGGDNMDLALAHHVEQRLGLEQRGVEGLSPQAWSVLVRQCQRAKELLLGEDPPEATTLSLPMGGSRIVGKALQVELTRAEVVELLVDGFVPRVEVDEAPKSRVGFQEFGLPYAPDPGITRYSGRFLVEAGGREDGRLPAVRPDFILLNGGVFESSALTERILEVVGGWFQGDPDWELQQLRNDRLDLAVARGAAYFGLVRRGEGVRISGGLARSYYVGVETDEPGENAVCLIPSGMEEGETVELDRDFELMIRQPAEFPIFVSSLRTTDEPGELVPLSGEDLRALPPVRTVLRSGKKTTADRVRVRLVSHLTEVGTLEISCRELDGHRIWRLQFDARAATQTDVAAHEGTGEAAGVLEEETVERVRELVRETFGPEEPPPGAARPESLVKRLEVETGLARATWPPTLLREIWTSLMEVPGGRRRSEAHEARWLNLLGWSLRPGYGLALDDWRVAETWRFRMANTVEHPRNELCRAEWWILWRRLAGGLTSGQQRALVEPLLRILRGWLMPGTTKAKKGRKARPKGSVAGVPFIGGKHETAEAWRLLGALEWLDPKTKIELGTMILSAVAERGQDAWNQAGLWTLGRLGARVPQYGPLNTLVPLEVAEQWLGRLLDLDQPAAGSRPGQTPVPFAIFQLARRTRDRYRDISSKPRAQALAWLEVHNARPHLRELVDSGGSLDADEQRLAFGDSLPAGIRVV